MSSRTLEYDGSFQIWDRVKTPDGMGTVSALYPDTPYYSGRLVQVALDLDPSETPSRRYSDDELELLDS